MAIDIDKFQFFLGGTDEKADCKYSIKLQNFT